jgi:hypothetical protein
VRVEAANAQIEEFDQRVFGVLADATGAKVPSNPNSWWQWWYDQNYVYVPSQKPVQHSYQTQGFVIPLLVNNPSASVALRTTDSTPRPTPGSTARPRWPYSCLVAGTLVRTVEGLCPVDKILPGDLVLAQQVTSGELTYKPVLHTTVGPPAAILRIETQGDAIRATKGHLFWVSGRGWLRAQQLEPGMQFHTASGTSSIRSVTPESDMQPVYNLVLPDFHTYFVGRDEVLSYDNTPLQRTTHKVPGLSTS